MSKKNLFNFGPNERRFIVDDWTKSDPIADIKAGMKVFRKAAKRNSEQKTYYYVGQNLYDHYIGLGYAPELFRVITKP